MIFRPDAARVSQHGMYRLAFSPGSTFSGEAQGRRAGASVEFLDHRRYVPGDDPRWLDWRAYARTDQLLVKRYREEVRPLTEVWIDGSASMAVCPRKAQFALDLGVMLGRAARAQGHMARISVLGGRRWKPEDPVELEYGCVRPLAGVVGEQARQLSPGSLAILVSDFLSPHDAGRLVASITARASRPALVQVLSGDDAAPAFGGRLELEDPETGRIAEVEIDGSARSAYLRRLAVLSGALRKACLQAGGLMAELRADRDFHAQCGGELVRAGLLGRK